MTIVKNSAIFDYESLYIDFKEDEMSRLPKDPVMLLSFVNTQLRDNYSNLSEMASSYMVSEQEILDKLSTINYEYDANLNKFI